MADNRNMRLLERESQIEALAEYALEASRGEGRLVLVSGEAGVGKSSLLEQLEGNLTDAQWFWGPATASSRLALSARCSTSRVSWAASSRRCAARDLRGKIPSLHSFTR